VQAFIYYFHLTIGELIIILHQKYIFHFSTLHHITVKRMRHIRICGFPFKNSTKMKIYAIKGQFSLGTFLNENIKF